MAEPDCIHTTIWKAESNEMKNGKRKIPVIYANVVLASVIILVVVEQSRDRYGAIDGSRVPLQDHGMEEPRAIQDPETSIKHSREDNVL